MPLKAPGRFRAAPLQAAVRGWALVRMRLLETRDRNQTRWHPLALADGFLRFQVAREAAGAHTPQRLHPQPVCVCASPGSREERTGISKSGKFQCFQLFPSPNKKPSIPAFSSKKQPAEGRFAFQNSKAARGMGTALLQHPKPHRDREAAACTNHSSQKASAWGCCTQPACKTACHKHAFLGGE